jgi:hypothetical protein
VSLPVHLKKKEIMERIDGKYKELFERKKNE